MNNLCRASLIWLGCCWVALGLHAPLAAQEQHHMAELKGIKAVHAWTPAGNASTAYIYVDIFNHGSQPVSVQGLSVDGQLAPLVGFRLRNGQPSTQVVELFPLAPNQALILAPNLMAFELSGWSGRRQGDRQSAQLLTSLGPLPIIIEVESANARQHSHAGHRH